MGLGLVGVRGGGGGGGKTKFFFTKNPNLKKKYILGGGGGGWDCGRGLEFKILFLLRVQIENK